MLTVEDVIIKKKWHEASVVTLLLFPVFAFLFLLGTGLMMLPTSVVVAVGCGIILGGWVSFLLCYCFSYRKTGTKYLTFILVVGPVLMVKDIIQEFRSGPTLGSLLFLGIEVALYIWWYRSALDLRHLNKRMQFEEEKQVGESVF